jgi:predicted enzyme related to lactoylglutathione lyase
MTPTMKTVIYPVKDLARAKEFYSTLLGVAPTSDAPYYVGFRIGDQEIGLDPHGHDQGLTGPVGYYDVDDIAKTLEVLVDAGGQIQRPASDVGGGMLVALVTDADGNVIGFRQSPA